MNAVETRNADTTSTTLRHTVEVSERERPFEFMMNALRLHEPVSLALFEQRTGLPRSVLHEQITQAKQQQLLTSSSETVTVTQHGRQFLNDAMAVFL